MGDGFGLDCLEQTMTRFKEEKSKELINLSIVGPTCLIKEWILIIFDGSFRL